VTSSFPYAADAAAAELLILALVATANRGQGKKAREGYATTLQKQLL
jgi:hypothetical protein